MRGREEAKEEEEKEEEGGRRYSGCLRERYSFSACIGKCKHSEAARKRGQRKEQQKTKERQRIRIRESRSCGNGLEGAQGGCTYVVDDGNNRLHQRRLDARRVSAMQGVLSGGKRRKKLTITRKKQKSKVQEVKNRIAPGCRIRRLLSCNSETYALAVTCVHC